MKSTVLSVQEIRNINKVTNEPKSTVASKTAKSVDLVEKVQQTEVKILPTKLSQKSA